MFQRLLLAATLVLVPGASVAGTLSITFDLSSSRFVLDPDPLLARTRSSGQVVVALDGVDENGMLVGAEASGRVTGFNLSIALEADLNGGTLGSQFDFTQMQPASGPFDGTQLMLTDGLPSTVVATPFCTGGGCTLIDVFGPTTSPFFTQRPFPVTLDGLAQPGAGLLLATFGTQVPGFTIEIRGTEVARGFVPEPSSVSLLALALTLLARRRLPRCS